MVTMVQIRKHKLSVFLSSLLCFFLFLIIEKAPAGIKSFFFDKMHERFTQVEWTNIGATPQAENRFTPQGLVYINGAYFLAESQNDEKSCIYKITLQKTKYVITGQFFMPTGAVHTSGLTWDGEFLWAVDYASRNLYKIDLHQSIVSGSAKIIATYGTGLKGPSAITYIRVDDTPYMAISDFMNTRRTYIVPHDDRKYAENSISSNAIFSYRNNGFSQGLEWHGQYLYESGNLLYKDGIYIMDLCRLFQSKNMMSSLVKIVEGPSNKIEDIAIGSGKLMTSDESSYSIYYTELMSSYAWLKPTKRNAANKSLQPTAQSSARCARSTLGGG